ncbi:CRISPR-associated endonuclease Cas2 [Thermodesulfovibrionales bacterium]|nr:CRISPR-associated endonuclease Cas2 [Thermodesulfovibrionales bacterium]
MLDFGGRVQYSVFECIMDGKLLEKMIKRIEKIINNEDSVRIYPLCAKCNKTVRILGSGEVSKDKDVYII